VAINNNQQQNHRIMPTTLRCDPALLEKDLTGQVIVVTGANSGCGLETSRQLVKQGATCILACRSQSKGEEAAKDVGGIFLAPLDLSSLESVKNFVSTFLEKYDRLDALVNNAGIMACPHGKTDDGFEMQFGCNHLAHFLLMDLLTPILLKTAETTKKPSRFVVLSSCAASETTMRDGFATVDFEDVMFETREYDEFVAYQQSKLANYLHAMEAAKKYPSDKLISTAVHPGWVYSNLDNHYVTKVMGDNFVARFLAEMMRQVFLWKGDMIMPVDGAQTTLYCLLEDADKVESGAFYSQFGIYKDPDLQPGGWPMKKSVNPDNATPENAATLWDVSKKLVNT
jgi:NAD(P)-dependent dehydrogenase (short-subunit alcohol dehydrogenase family)